MKRSIPFLLVLVLALSAGTMLIPDAASTYTPREDAPATLAAGAAEVRHNLLADPATGEINYDYISRVETALSRMSPEDNAKNLDYNWTSAGPNNTGGRTRAIHTDVDNPQRVFIGAVTGGLFQSFNGGEEWQTVESFDENPNVSSITRTGDGKIYVGTGHFAEGFRGNGLYVSEDDGESWNTVQNFKPDQDLDNSSIWSRVNVLMADPNQDDRVWIAHLGGLSTYDWGDEDVVERISSNTTSLSMTDDGQVMIAVSNDKVYVSTDGGQNFDNRSGNGFGLVPSTSIGRVEVAVSPDNANYMYALIAAPNGYLRGMYASTNMGQTWYELYGSSNNGASPFSPFSVADQGQGNYDNAISVIPGQPEKVIIGGIRMYLVEIEGENPPQKQYSVLNNNFSQGPSPDYVHSDIHTFHWDVNDVLYIGCDGGIFKSENQGQSFISRNYNYRSTQFYGMDFNNRGWVIAGSQDNGTHVITGFNISNNDSQEVLGGDGFDCVFSKVDPQIAFGTIYNNEVQRSFDAGISGNQILTEEEYPGPFWTIIDMDEDLEATNANAFPYLATQDIPSGTTIEYASESYSISLDYLLTEDLDAGETIMLPDPYQSLFCVGGLGSFRMTRDATKSTVAAGDIDWVTVSDGVSGTITCFEFSPDHNHLYIGNSGGQVYRISGLNNAYDVASLTAAAENITTIHPGGGSISDLAIDPNNNDRLLISKPGYSEADKLYLSEVATTTTGSSSFESVWNLPSGLELMPAYSCLFDKDNSDHLLVGTEYGVWVSEDLGANWTECNLNMGRVPVYALEQQSVRTEDLTAVNRTVMNEGSIYAGTFGKGVYYVGDYILGIDDLGSGDTDFAADLSIYPNPMAAQGTLNLSMLATSEVTLSIFDMKGQLMNSLPQGRLNTGDHVIDFNVNNLSEGTYLLRVQAGSEHQTLRFIVNR